jgi:hypothetical protein
MSQGQGYDSHAAIEDHSEILAHNLRVNRVQDYSHHFQFASIDYKENPDKGLHEA